MAFNPQWAFSVETEHLKLANILTGEVFYFLRRNTSFYPVEGSNEILEINSQSTNLVKRINRNESITPAPGANIEAYLDSLATLASA